MSYPTPVEFAEALVAHKYIESADIHVRIDIAAKYGFATGLGERATLSVRADPAAVSADIMPSFDMDLTLSDGRVIGAWFPHDAPHWAAVAVGEVRDGWPITAGAIR